MIKKQEFEDLIDATTYNRSIEKGVSLYQSFEGEDKLWNWIKTKDKKQRDDIIDMIEEEMKLHTHNSIPSYTADLEEGCVICKRNKVIQDILDKIKV